MSISLHSLRSNVDQASPVEGTWVRWPAVDRQMACDLVVVTLLSAAALYLSMRLWQVDLSSPLHYEGDGLYSLRDAITMKQTGWVQTSPRLGAPFGQSMYDYPMSVDNGNYVVMRFLSVFVHDPIRLINAFFLAGFFSTSWIAYLALRSIRSHRAPAIAGAVIFTFAPYHFLRGAHHLFLGVSSWVLAVAVVLAVRSAAGDTITSRRSSVARPWRRGLLVVALCLICGSFGAYYAVFSAITIVAAGIIGAIAFRVWRPVLAGLQHAAVIGAAVILNLAPTILYRLRNGPNPVAVSRDVAELDIYGLRVSQMLTPVRGHVFAPLDWLSGTLMRGYTSEPSQFLGIVGSIGLLGMIGSVLLAGIRRRGPSDRDPRFIFAVLTLCWILFATTGGLDWVLAIVKFQLIRSWSRTSILLLFLAIAWLALGITHWIEARPAHLEDKEGRQRWQRWPVIAAALVATIAVVDQVPFSIVPKTTKWAASYRSDQAFFGALEADLPTGAMVYQLPYRRFPEEQPTAESYDYDLLRPFINTTTLRWSYGGMKGRAGDWQDNLVGLSPERLTEALSAAGFDGVLIDRYGYVDSGAALEGQLATLLGASPATSEDGRWSYFSMTSVRQRLTGDQRTALADAFLSPVRVVANGCSNPEPVAGSLMRWCGSRVTLDLTDPLVDRPKHLRARLVAGTGTGTVLISVDGTTTSYPISKDGTAIDLALPLRSGQQIRLSADVQRTWAPNDYRDLRFQIVDLTVLPAELPWGSG